MHPPLPWCINLPWWCTAFYSKLLHYTDYHSHLVHFSFSFKNSHLTFPPSKKPFTLLFSSQKSWLFLLLFSAPPFADYQLIYQYIYENHFHSQQSTVSSAYRYSVRFHYNLLTFSWQQYQSLLLSHKKFINKQWMTELTLHIFVSPLPMYKYSETSIHFFHFNTCIIISVNCFDTWVTFHPLQKSSTHQILPSNQLFLPTTKIFNTSHMASQSTVFSKSTNAA